MVLLSSYFLLVSAVSFCLLFVWWRKGSEHVLQTRLIPHLTVAAEVVCGQARFVS